MKKPIYWCVPTRSEFELDTPFPYEGVVSKVDTLYVTVWFPDGNEIKVSREQIVRGEFKLTLFNTIKS